MAGGGGDMPPVGRVNVEEMTTAFVLCRLGENKRPFLNEMTADARNGDVDQVGKALFTLKAGLLVDQAKVSLADVMDGEDLIPLLIRGLKSNKVPVQQNASWIICDIMVKGTPEQREKVMVGEGAAIYPILLEMLASSDEKIWQHALNTLVWMFDKERTRPQLRDPAIIPAITKLAEKTNDRAQLCNVSKVAGFFCKSDPKDDPHSVDTVRQLVALFGIVSRNTKDDQITNEILKSLLCLVIVEEFEKVIVSGGILPWVVGHLCSPDGLVRSAVTCLLYRCGAGSGPKVVDLLKGVKGTEGMKDIYKCVWASKAVHPDTGVEVTSSKTDLEQLFLTVNATLISGDATLKIELRDAVLESGFVVSLVKCLDEKKTPEPFPMIAASILTEIMDVLDPKRLDLVVDAGAVPVLVEMLGSSNKTNRLVAIVCLGARNLIKTGPKVRDEVIELGGLDKLIGLLEGDDREEVEGTLGILRCFEDLLATKPMAGLDKYEKLAACLKELLEEVVLAWFLANSNIESVGKVMIRVFRCVGHLAAYGKEGLELVEKCGILERIIELLPYNHLEAQRVALETLIGICEADENYVPVLIRKGIMEHFELLCYHRGMEFVSGFGILFEFLGKGLTPGQQQMLKHIIQTKHSSLTEMHAALVGSEDPVAVFKAQIDKVLSRQARVDLYFL